MLKKFFKIGFGIQTWTLIEVCCQFYYNHVFLLGSIYVKWIVEILPKVQRQVRHNVKYPSGGKKNKVIKKPFRVIKIRGEILILQGFQE